MSQDREERGGQSLNRRFTRDGTSSTYSAIPTDEDETSEKPPSRHVKLWNSTRGWWQRTMFDSWVPEVAATTVSSGCLIAIAAVLWAYHDGPLPELPRHVNLNTLIAVLATISRSMMIFTVASAIGQLKWCWYHQSKRQLYDLQVFDDASRGPWGSIDLLSGTHARSLASIGAVITILALAFDPAVQSSLSTPTRSIKDNNARATVLRAPFFMEDSKSDAWTNAVGAGIWSPAQQFEQQPTCPNGNCTWPSSYTTVGWCSKCRNATSYANMGNCSLPFGQLGEYWTYEFDPKNVTFNISDACFIDFGHGNSFPLIHVNSTHTDDNLTSLSLSLMTDAVWTLGGADGALYGGDDYPDPRKRNFTFLDVTNPILALGHASADWCNETSLNSGVCISSATECVLSLCETVLHPFVTTGTVDWQYETSNFGYITRDFRYVIGPLPRDTGIYLAGPVCWQRDIKTKLPPYNHSDPTTERFCPSSLTEIDTPDHSDYGYKQSLADILGGTACNVGSQEHPWILYSSSSMRYIASHSRSFDEILEGVAASLNALGRQANTTITETGFSWRTETYVSVVWPWLALPTTIELGTIVLLWIAMLISRRYNLPLWKSSILPLLYHGLEFDTRPDQDIPDDIGTMVTHAKSSRVELVRRR